MQYSEKNVLQKSVEKLKINLEEYVNRNYRNSLFAVQQKTFFQNENLIFSEDFYCETHPVNDKIFVNFKFNDLECLIYKN